MNIGKGDIACMTRPEIKAHEAMNLLIGEIRVFGIELIGATKSIAGTLKRSTMTKVCRSGDLIVNFIRK